MPRAPLLTLLIALFSLAGAQAQLDSPERRQLERDLERYEELLTERTAELGRIEALLGETAANMRARIRERDLVSEELAAKRREREELLGQIEALGAQVRAAEERILQQEARLAELKVRVQELLVSVYKQRGRRSAAGLAGSASFHELRVRNHYLGLLARQDADVITELDRAIVELEGERARLNAHLAELEAAEVELAAAEAELQRSVARLAAIIDELNATQAGQAAQQEALIAEQTQIERSLGDVTAQLEREIARLREEERRAREAAAAYAQDRARQLELERQADEARARADALAAPAPPIETGYSRPFDGASLISRYGERNNSYIGIRAPVANAAVRAVQSGRVAAVTYLGANLGYMVAVQHSDGLMTIYVNLRQPLVELGHLVSQSEILGYLGGGTLTRNDVLQFYAQRTAASGNAFIDPAPLLGW